MPDLSIMIVEDDDSIREILIDLVRAAGYQTQEAPNGQAALDQIRGGASPDLILLDWMMPVMSGWDFLKERSKESTLSRIPVIVVTALDPAEVKIPEGVDCLRKPFSFKTLVEVIEKNFPRA